ncbi:hypothetical protein CPB86DRAFT_813648 [Serendipita vermifera]|nr:hypothetical protein CPB86DRAFT_813648 [Serendipita vermifera]
MFPIDIATAFLLVHLVVRGAENRVLRTFSVSEDYDPGGSPISFAQMNSDTRNAIEAVWRQLDNAERPAFDPLNAVFALVQVRKLGGSSGWDNDKYVLIFQCGRAKKAPSNPDAPLMLLHLSKPSNAHPVMLKNQFMIARNCDLGAIPTTYDWMETDWRKATKEQLDRVNNFEGDITRHPWALKAGYRILLPRTSKEPKPVLDGITLVLEWQDSEPASNNNPHEHLRPMIHVTGSSASNANLETPAALPPYSASEL